MTADLRGSLIKTALEWERRYGVAPAITSAISEYDAATLVGCLDDLYGQAMAGKTSVTRGHDFIHDGVRYQVKANRPSGKPGSRVTLVPKPKNYEWDQLIWILYDPSWTLQEAWRWDRAAFQAAFDHLDRLSPAHMRGGHLLAGTPDIQSPSPRRRVPDAPMATRSPTVFSTRPATRAVSQRDQMRMLVGLHGYNRDVVCRAYAQAEREGAVDRKSATTGTTPEEYAYALWADGRKKGWL